MSLAQLEKRVAVLETELARLKSQKRSPYATDASWLDRTYGRFANDPMFEEAMRLGRIWRELQRPRARKRSNSKRKRA